MPTTDHTVWTWVTATTTMLTRTCENNSMANRIKNLDKLLMILSDRPFFFLFIKLQHAPLQLCNTTCYLIDPCVCVCVCLVHYIIRTTTWKSRVTEIHNTYHANEKMFWDWTPDYPCGLASPTLLQVAVCCLDGVTTIVIKKIILICCLHATMAGS